MRRRVFITLAAASGPEQLRDPRARMALAQGQRTAP
jgi:hypothetical protein